MAAADDDSPTARLLAEVLQKETQRRLQAAVELFSFFQNQNSVFDFEDLDKLVEGLAGWTNSGNPKICTNGIDLMLIVINSLGEKFRPYIGGVLPILRERLGDQRQQVRTACVSLLLDMMAAVKSPQSVLDKLLPTTLAHKAWHVREQGLLLVSKALDLFGSQELLVGRYMAPVCKLTEDANFQVREQANATLVTFYCHVGERIRHDLEKKGVPAVRLSSLLSRFDEALASGKMLVVADPPKAQVQEPPSTAKASNQKQPGRPPPESSRPPESGRTIPKGPRYSLPGPNRPGANAADGAVASKPRSRHSIASAQPARNIISGKTTACAAAGAVGEEDFRRGFDDCPSLGPLSARAFEDEMVKVQETMMNTNLNWELRSAACKRLRSLLKADATAFIGQLQALEEPVRTSVKDLRSTLMREACITVSMMAQDLSSRMERFCESILPALCMLLPNSAKVMASSAHTCVSFIIKNVHSGRFVSLFAAQYAAKSPLTRRRILEYLDSILHSWPPSVLEKHPALLEEVVKKGIHDADSAVRTAARSTFWGLMDHFPTQAEKLRSGLDASRQRLLDDQKAIMNGEVPVRPAVGSQKARSRGHLNRRFTSEPDLSPIVDRRPGAFSAGSDSSAAGGIAMADLSGGGGATSHSSWSISTAPVTTAGETTTNSSVAISTGRRSLAHTVPAMAQATTARSHARRASGGGGVSGVGMPVYGGQKPASSASATSAITLSKPPQRPSSAMSAVSCNEPQSLAMGAGPDELQPLSDLISEISRFDSSSLPLVPSSRREQDDDVASQGSFASHGSRGSRGSRGSTSSTGLSQSGSRFRITQDIPEMQRLCASGVWQERRDGLGSLQELMKTERVLSKYEISKFTELFYRMFRDPHHIVVSLFLEVLKAFVNIYHAELVAWLPTLLQLCFHKSSGDLRSSISLRLHALLSDVKEKFDARLQLLTVFQLLEDQSKNSTPTYKLVMFMYLEQLIPAMDPGDFVSAHEYVQGLSTTIARSLEAGNGDVRRSATRVVAALFELNTATFTTMLSSLPRNYQDHARKVMQSHMQGTISPSTGHSPATMRSHSSGSNLAQMKSSSSSSPDLRDMRRSSPAGIAATSAAATAVSGIPKPPSSKSGASPPSPRQPAKSSGGSSASSPRASTAPGTVAPASAAAQPGQVYRPGSPQSAVQQQQQQQTEAVRRTASSPLSSVNKLPLNTNDRADGSATAPSARGIDRTAAASNGRAYNPALYQSPTTEASPASHAHSATAGDGPVLGLFRKACNKALPGSDRVKALTSLRFYDWQDAPLSGVLMPFHDEVNRHLAELLRAEDGDVQYAALQVFEQLFAPSKSSLNVAPDPSSLPPEPWFVTQADILTCFDAVIQCVCSEDKRLRHEHVVIIAMLGSNLPAEELYRVVLPCTAAIQYPQIECYLKLLSKVCGRLPGDLLLPDLGVVVPRILKSFNHSESFVRHAALNCLVELQLAVGKELLSPHLNDLTTAQTKLVELYVRRASAQKKGGDSTAPPS